MTIKVRQLNWEPSGSLFLCRDIYRQKGTNDTNERILHIPVGR